MSQTRYFPSANEETFCVSKTAPVTASRISTLCERPLRSQSRKYIAMRCVLPSVTFTLIVKLVVDSHDAAMRSVAVPDFCKQRVSVLLCAQVQSDFPVA